MIKTVFLDMDEVLVSFNRGVCNYFNIPYQYENFTKNYKWFPEIGQTYESVSAICNTKFWQNLNWMHDGHDILRLVASVFRPEQIYLLTTPMPNPDSYTGKALWVQRYLSEYSERLIVTAIPKSLFAKPDTLLIDDKDENVNEFHEAGGRGLLVPRPWNADYGMAHHTLEVVCDRLEDHLNAG